MDKPAVLALADGTVFHGRSVGADGKTVGEVVFNTAMTGYQEILTDPSYAQQIVTLTYPHIGNTGTNAADGVGCGACCKVLIIRDLPLVASNFRSEQNLSDYLVANNTVCIADIDTRKLTRIIREKGAQAGCILTGDAAEEAIAAANAFPGLKGMDLAKVVTTETRYEWVEPSWQLGVEAPERPEALPCRGTRLWCEAQHSAYFGGFGLPGNSGSRSNRFRDRHGLETRWRFLIQWPW